MLGAVLALIPTAWAAPVTIGETLWSIPLTAWLAVFGPSTFAAVFVLAIRLEKETPPRLGFIVWSQLMTSWTAGVMAFGLAQWQGVPDMGALALIFIASIAGTKAIEPAVMWFARRFHPGGGPPPGPSQHPST